MTEKRTEMIFRLYSEGRTLEQIRHEMGYKSVYTVMSKLNTHYGISFKRVKKEIAADVKKAISKEYIESGKTLKELAIKYKIDQSTISDIVAKQFRIVRNKHVSKYVSSLEAREAFSDHEMDYGTIDFNSRYDYKQVEREKYIVRG